MSHAPVPRLQRDVAMLDRNFDVLVVGAGIYGATIASAAARQGLSVAVIDRGDFGAATSHNSLKTVHGGLRYIQHLDMRRIRESVRAQNHWLTIAPHLVRPLRFVIPTYGLGTRGSLVLAAGIAAFELVAWDRNRGLSGRARLPRGGLISRKRLLADYPMLAQGDVRGGAFWYDAQMIDANRLTIECLLDASAHGARIANYVEADAFLRHDGAIAGTTARCLISGKQIEVRARLTINAAGPWAERLLERNAIDMGGRPLAWSRNMNVVIRQLVADSALGVTSQRSSDAAIGKSKRLFFVSPWRDCSIVGTSHEHFSGTPDSVQPSEAELTEFVAELASAMPSAHITRRDVRYVHAGLTPAELDENAGTTRSAHRPAMMDHGTRNLRGLITAIGIKYTTAPVVAEQVVALACAALARPFDASRTRMNSRLQQNSSMQPSIAAQSQLLPDDDDVTWAHLSYGAAIESVLGILPAAGLSPSQHIFRCRVLYGIRHEMALRLRDGVFRCTDFVERGCLSEDELVWCAETFRRELGWEDGRTAEELRMTRAEIAARYAMVRPAGALPSR